jgi:hypothetical protein
MSRIWEELEQRAVAEAGSSSRSYRRLDLKRETGIRLGCTSPEGVWELLVESGDASDSFSVEFPKWKGMEFEILRLDVPRKDSLHIRLFLQHPEHRNIFVTVCSDLIRGLDGCLTSESRRREIINFLAKWGRFFERHGQEGLSAEHQRGLYGELWWLRKLAESGMPSSFAVNSWIGCRGGYHDFDISGYLVEVKTTMTKEPRKVVISNERQLDDLGLNMLHLFVLTIAELERGGESLPEIIQSLRGNFAGEPSSSLFESSLLEAGYLDFHARLYRRSYRVVKEELFHVTGGFPRLIRLPAGVGDLRYSIVLAACPPFEREISIFLKNLVGVA